MVGPLSNRNSSDSLENIAHLLFKASIAPATAATYSRMLSNYEQFCEIYFPGVQIFPSTQNMVSQFIAKLFLQNLSPSTIASYLSAISFVHKAKNILDPTDNFIVKKILKGVQNIKGHSDTRLPITGPISCKLIDSLPKVVTTPYHQMMLKAMFLLAFYAFLRIGEITVKCKKATTVLQLTDVTFRYGDKNLLQGVDIILKNYKHSDHPKTIYIPSDSLNKYCPVKALLEYCSIAQNKTGPLFCFPCGSPVTHSYFSNCLKLSLAFNNLDPKLYKGHSFRIGAATAAAANNVPVSVIQTMGRWKSDAFKHYIRMQNFHL